MTWQTNRTMTGPEFQALVRRLGMQQHHAAKWLGITDRQARRYVLGDTPVPTATVLLLRSMAHHREQPLVPKLDENAAGSACKALTTKEGDSPRS
jgi:hypothetical protein